MNLQLAYKTENLLPTKVLSPSQEELRPITSVSSSNISDFHGEDKKFES